jgi:hypothetical protein
MPTTRPNDRTLCAAMIASRGIARFHAMLIEKLGGPVVAGLWPHVWQHTAAWTGPSYDNLATIRRGERASVVSCLHVQLPYVLSMAFMPRQFAGRCGDPEHTKSPGQSCHANDGLVRHHYQEC